MHAGIVELRGVYVTIVCTWYSVGIWKIRYYDVNSVVTVHSVLIYITHGSQTIYNARILQ